MAQLNPRQMWTRLILSVRSPAWLIAHLGCYLVLGTALLLVNILTTPASLWFWRPMALLGVLLAMHGVITLAQARSAWFRPVVARARLVWPRLGTVREALLVPAVAGVVAMPGLLSLSSTKPAVMSPGAEPSVPGFTPAPTDQSLTQEAATTTPAGWRAPAGWSQPTTTAAAQSGSAPAEPVPTSPPPPPSYATWPTPPDAPVPADRWLVERAPEQSSPVPGWPVSPVTMWPAGPPTPTAAAPQPVPPWPTTRVGIDCRQDPVADQPPARPAPSRLIERDSELIGAHLYDPEDPSWDHLELAANSWLARRAADHDAAGAAP